MIPRTKIENRALDIVASCAHSRKGSLEELKHTLSIQFSLPLPLLTSCASAGFYYLLKALPNKKIYLPAYTCRSLIEACAFAGRLDDLRLIDIELDTYGMNSNELEQKIENNSIIVATHQFGIPAPIDRFLEIAKKTGSLLIEDNAAAFGAKFHGQLTGTWGDVSMFSFDYSKTFSACGGGAVFFRDSSLQKETERIHNLEIQKNFPFETRSLVYGLLCNIATHEWIYGGLALPLWRLRNGYYKDRGQLRTERLAYYRRPFLEKQAQLALNMMKVIDRVMKRRKRIEHQYLERLKAHPKITLYKPLQNTETAMLMFPIRVVQGDKLEFYRHCAFRGIDLGFTFSYCNNSADSATELKNSKLSAKQVLNLPFYSKLSDKQIDQICHIISGVG